MLNDRKTSSMYTKITFRIFICLIVCSFFGCINDDDENGEIVNYVGINNRVPSFSVPDLDGNVFYSNSFEGKTSLLLLYFTTCPICQKELPIIDDVWKLLKDDPDYQVITISREETQKDVQAYWKKEELSMPTYLDTDRKVFSLFANSTVPRLYVINSDMIITWMEIGKTSYTAEELVDIIKGAKK